MSSTLGHQNSETVVHDVGKHDVPIRQQTLQSGCSTILLEVLCGDLFLTPMFAASGWLVSSPLDLPTDTFNPTDVIHRRILDKRIKLDDPCCLVLNCGEWGDNLATTWIEELVSTRVPGGQVVLLCRATRTRRRDDHGHSRVKSRSGPHAARTENTCKRF